MAWLTGWNRRKSKIINGSTAGTQINYQMQLTVHKGSGADTSTDIYLDTNVRNDFGDVRFTKSDGSSLLNYWIESYTSGVSAIVWIQIDSIPASPSSLTIYIYYDNSSAISVSNGTNTFEFFDDFDGTSVDTTKWTSTIGTISEASGYMTHTGGVWNMALSSYSGTNYSVRTSVRVSSVANDKGIVMVRDNGLLGDSSRGYMGTMYSTPAIAIVRPNVASDSSPVAATINANTFYVYELAVFGDNQKFTFNNSIINSKTYANYSSGYMLLGGIGGTVDYDWVFVRKYTSPEPTWSCSGGEEVFTISWLTGWNRRKSKIVNGSTSSQTNYQMKLTVHKTTGIDTPTDIYLGTNVRNDFGDVRFTKTDGSTLLNYWIDQSSLISGISTDIWIQIDSIQASPCTTTIYVYYDNSPQTTTSNGTNTFEFFDDFSGDLSKWTLSSSNTISISNNILQVGAETAGQYIRSNNIITINDLAFEFKLSRDISGSQWTAVIHGAANPNSNGYLYSLYPPINYRKIFRDGTSIGTDRGTAINDINTWHNYKLVRKSSGILELWEDNILIKDASGETTKTSGYVGFTTLPETLRNIKIDDVRVRKYASPEPTWSCSGGEEVYTISWLSGWNRRKSKIINGSTSGVQTNYQIKLTAHKTTGVDTSTDIYLGTNVRNDFGDVRFTKNDGSTLLNYWIDPSFLISGISADIWIQTDSIPASPCTSTIYIYYDNSSQTSISNGGNTFIFFDDFGGTSVDTTKWGTQGTPTVSNSEVVFSNAGESGIYSLNTFSYPIVLQGNMRRTVSNTGYLEFGLAIDQTTRPVDSTEFAIAYPYQGGVYRTYSRLNGGTIQELVQPNFNYLTHQPFLIKWLSTSSLVIESVVSSQTHTTVPDSPLYIRYRGWNIDSGALDRVFVRKYASPEPTFGLSSAEESNITAIAMTLNTNSCLGPCSITADVTWQNLSTSSITFRPAILIDGTTIFDAVSDITIAAGGTGLSSITTTTLSVGSHSICPYPN